MNKVEGSIQKEVVKYCRQSKLFNQAFHVLNEGNKTTGEAMQDKRMGLLAGVPDLCIPMPYGLILWLELKTMKGAVSPNQKKRHEYFAQLGHTVHVTKGLSKTLELLKQIEYAYDHYETIDLKMSFVERRNHISNIINEPKVWAQFAEQANENR